jgi:glutamate synthase (ferredoxin)
VAAATTVPPPTGGAAAGGDEVDVSAVPGEVAELACGLVGVLRAGLCEDTASAVIDAAQRVLDDATALRWEAVRLLDRTRRREPTRHGRDTAEAVASRETVRAAIDAACRAEGARFLAWRLVPTAGDALGRVAADGQPALVQAILERPHHLDEVAAERLAYRIRRRARKASEAEGARFYAASCSFATVTYKAMAAADQLDAFYLDLRDERFVSSLAVFHSRFSTNTAPTWERAQPFRMLCHNGEINTIDGNHNLMRAREGQLVPGSMSVDGEDWVEPALLHPVIDADQSDSAKLDSALELLVRGGRDIRHAQAMLVPQVWEGARDVDPEIRDFYRYHGCLIEPWDGPAG